MFCKNCSREFSGKFCPNCGKAADENNNINTNPKDSSNKTNTDNSSNTLELNKISAEKKKNQIICYVLFIILNVINILNCLDYIINSIKSIVIFIKYNHIDLQNTISNTISIVFSILIYLVIITFSIIALVNVINACTNKRKLNKVLTLIPNIIMIVILAYSVFINITNILMKIKYNEAISVFIGMIIENIIYIAILIAGLVVGNKCYIKSRLLEAEEQINNQSDINKNIYSTENIQINQVSENSNNENI